MNKYTWVLGMLMMGCVVVTGGCDAVEADRPKLSIDTIEKISETMLSKMVIVEYDLKFDRGQAPYAMGQFSQSYDVDELVGEERPLELPGYFVTPTEVVTVDVAIHPRFIKSIHIRIGDKRVRGKISRLVIDQPAAFIEIEEPLDDASVLAFEKPDPKASPVKKDDPKAAFKKLVLVVSAVRSEADWTTVASPMGTAVWTPTTTPPMRQVGGRSSLRILVNANGDVLGATARGTIDPDTHSWKGSPIDWPTVDAANMTKLLKSTQGITDAAIFRVKLHLRSPKQKPGRYNNGDEKTEMQTFALLTGPKQLLVLANLDPKTTARLERIQVYLPDSRTMLATFHKSLKDYGAFTATLDEPLAGALKLSDVDPRILRLKSLPTAELQIRGELREAFYQPVRIYDARIGWREHIYPALSRRGEKGHYLFDTEGHLLAMPIERRKKNGGGSRSRGSGKLTAAKYVGTVLANLDTPEHVDASNVPLSEATESRLAWLGMYLQGLDPELARENNVSQLTNNGQTGALVSYVYPESPAGKAGVKPGWILLRLHSPEQPEPIRVRGTGAGSQHFPRIWQFYDRIGEQQFDQIPRPWPGAENSLTTTLTNLGLGKKVTGEFFVNGKVKRIPFTIVEGPTHFDTAKRFHDKPLGVTVRNMTYETRRYFLRKKSEGGVIISKVDLGSKASQLGMRPFELITSVNGKPVANVDAFEKAIAPRGELNIGVKRWTRGRVIKVDMGK